MKEMLKQLSLLNGVSGDEEAVREYIIEQIKGYCTYHVDNLGNLIAFKKGKQVPARKIMVSAHMDEVGLIITGVTADGMLRFTTVGGMDARVIIGRQVEIGRRRIVGIIGTKAVHMQTVEEKSQAVAVDKLYIDIGAQDQQEALQQVSLGDRACFVSEFVLFGDGFIKGKALDDRVGCAVMIDLIQSELAYDCYFTFVVQEEVGLRGAKVAAFSVEPEVAIVLEATTAADVAGVDGSDQVCVCGNGAVVSFMDRHTVYDKGLYELAFSLAQQNGIKCQTKTKVAGGNDAGAISLSRGGVRTAAISVPCRYLHSASCVLKYEDVQAVRALCGLVLDRVAAL